MKKKTSRTDRPVRLVRKYLLYVEAEIHDVAVLHNILLTFDMELASFAHTCFRTVADVVVVLNDFSTNKAALEIGMYNTSALRSFPTLVESPGFHFHLACGDERFQL